MTVSENSRVYAATDISNLYRDDDRSIEEKYGKFIAPYLKIEISDKNDALLFSAENVQEEGVYDFNGLIVNDVDFEENIDEADMITITVNNPKLDLHDSNLFVEGNNIDLYMGYDGRAPFFMARGIIVEIQPEFPADQIPTIKLTCYDKSYFMMEEGRAEIDPENSIWWERGTVQQTAPQQEELLFNNAYASDDMDEEEIASRQWVNEQAESQGEDIRMRMGGVDLAESEGNDLSVTPIVGGRITRTREQTQTPLARSAWRQHHFPRNRRQNSGKVWRNKKDSEIVATIFQSYGIVPYVEATNERVRRSRRITRPRPQPSTTLEVNDDEELAAMYRESDSQFEDEIEAEYSEKLEAMADLFGTRDLETDLEDAETPTETEDPTEELLPDEVEDRTIRDDTNHTWLMDQSDRYNAARWREYLESIGEATPPSTQQRAPAADRTVTQKSGTTDWEFIKTLAEKHSYIFFVFFHIESRRWVGYWGPENNVPQFREFIFRYNAGNETTISDVRPNSSLRNQSTEIDLIYVDPVTRKENRLRVSMENVSENMTEVRTNDIHTVREPIASGPEVTLAVNGTRVRVNADHRFRNPEDARLWLISYWLRHANDFVVLDGSTVIGMMEMRARQYHRIEGLGHRFSGRYFITMARHNMSPNSCYSTSFVARKDVPTFSGELESETSVLDQRDLGTRESFDPYSVEDI